MSAPDAAPAAGAPNPATLSPGLVPILRAGITNTTHGKEIAR